MSHEVEAGAVGGCPVDHGAARPEVARALADLPTPPGSFGYPLLGETLDYVRSPKQFIEDRRKKYGDIFKTQILGIKGVFVLGANANRWVFTNENGVLENRWNYAARKVLGDKVVAKLNGAEHKERRRLLAPHFTKAASARFAPRVREITRKHLEQWAEKGAPICVSDQMRRLTFDIAVSLLLGGGQEKLDMELLSVQFERLGLGIFVPVPVAIPGTTFGRALKAKRMLSEYIGRIVDARQQLPEQPDDLLGSLMKVRDDQGRPLPRQAIIDEAQLQLWAGHDTTVSALSNLMLQLALNPDTLARGRAEIDRAKPIEEITAEELEKLPYLNQLINESMRLVPPVSSAFRMVMQDTELKGYRIPKGWSVVLSMIGTGRESWWTDPDAFDPDRWGPERAEHKKDTYASIPFGGGPRVCVGQHFAMVEMRMVLAMLLKSYDWRLLADQDLRWVSLPFPRPRSGIVARFSRREAAVKQSERKGASKKGREHTENGETAPLATPN